MTLNRHSAAFLPIVFVAFAAGCGDEEATPEEQTVSKASALTAPVEEAHASPDGELSQGNAAAVFDTVDHTELSLDLTGSLPDGIDIDFSASVDASCLVDGDTHGAIDAACATGGDVSGTLLYEIGIDGTSTYVYYQFDDVCNDELCIDGEGAAKVITGGGAVQNIVAGDFTITRDGATHELRYGVTVIVDGGGVHNDVVVWHDGKSYVVSTDVESGGVSYSVTGANGTWECDLDGSLGSWSGSCSGAGSIEL